MEGQQQPAPATTSIEGIVSATSSKFNGGILIGPTWYNGTDRTKNFVNQVKKGDKVKLDIDEKNKVHFVKILESAPETPQQTFGNAENKINLSAEEKAVILDSVIGTGNNIMTAVKKGAEEIFGSDERYKDSIGQHVNSMFIFVTRTLKDKGIL